VLPDGVFAYQKSHFGSILDGLGLEKIGIFFGHLEYITGILYILWPFGNSVAIWYFSSVLVYCVTKNLATLVRSMQNKLSISYHFFYFFDQASIVAQKLLDVEHVHRNGSEGVKKVAENVTASRYLRQAVLK
jgi:hypothetical protein